ncbi:hypothetical protein [Parasulfitobacter algicola]|uniref:PH domain-containing protein n=1 Tax=Parasulfitobacter algicola TaxID=2614809 RepID=A0ABX2IWP0_9RHOB|nr:hypothetical protein [Sulfitobacter algicola]NSX55555.1 hypothetical protein [Sulfitobacter algicola]
MKIIQNSPERLVIAEDVTQALGITTICIALLFVAVGGSIAADQDSIVGFVMGAPFVLLGFGYAYGWIRRTRLVFDGSSRTFELHVRHLFGARRTIYPLTTSTRAEVQVTHLAEQGSDAHTPVLLLGDDTDSEVILLTGPHPDSAAKEIVSLVNGWLQR